MQREYELKKKTVSLTEQRAELIELNKAKDEFISLASHQLRTPASGVKQFLGMMLEEGFTKSNLPQEHRSLVELAYESNERQLQVIDDLLKVARVDAGNVVLKKRDFDLVPMITDILNEQAGTYKQRKQSVSFKHKLPHYIAYADKGKMRMVLENVIDNASKYTLPGKQVDIQLKKNKQFVDVLVKDEGVGINQKDIDKIFQKFSRLDNPLSVEVGGTGLGLYWAKK
jgi:signal transduction histidine kinase